MKTLIQENYSVLKTKDSENEFDISDSCWVLSRDVKLNFLHFERKVSKHLLNCIKETLAYTAVNFSSAYTRKFFYAINKYIKFNQDILNSFEYGALKRFYNTYYKSSYTHVESIKYFLIKFHELHGDLLSKEILYMVSKWQVSKPNKMILKTEQGVSSRPLIEGELVDLVRNVTKGYDCGDINMKDYLMVMLMIYTGRRPMQIAQLKMKDLYSKNDGGYLNIPRIKQGGQFRIYFTEVKIGSVLYSYLLKLKNVNIDFMDNELDKKLSHDEFDNLPLFMDSYFFNKTYDLKKFYENNFINLHMSSQKITDRLKYVYRVVNDLCSDTKPTINSRQLRTTLATRVAQKGYGLNVVAKILDHTNLESVICYAKNNEGFSFRIDEAINDLILPYASSFLTKISDTKQKINNDLLSIIKLTKTLLLYSSDKSEMEMISAFISIIESKIISIVNPYNIVEIE
ncbi:site-specific integrase [Yersinia ruckeri]|uniref:site-specific integrase n=1 Tax=Yersinia ruckeri TaxID=29486 RepID=UPI002237060E|nr:site-specific integrase [Yersinia ruckeri]MCW6556101.1 site-specific integrase [Yersinia ruckeri]UZX74427.1 site-specific integrase [Yersinia ruckeri]